MINKSSIRRKSKQVFQKVIELRKEGFSYGEIKKETGIAKSTINNWLTLAGLTLSKEHLKIQAKKRVENHKIATEASKITRLRKKEAEIQKTIGSCKKYFNDPFFNYGLALFEAEGSKETACRFSNSDFRLIEAFIMFMEKYFFLKRRENMTFRLYIHESRKKDLERIIIFWAQKLQIPKNQFRVSWKKNKLKTKRWNLNYVGQMSVTIKGEKVLGSKMMAISGIILKKYQKNYCGVV